MNDKYTCLVVLAEGILGKSVKERYAHQPKTMTLDFSFNFVSFLVKLSLYQL